jgi:hypothetical protein
MQWLRKQKTKISQLKYIAATWTLLPGVAESLAIQITPLEICKNYKKWQTVKNRGISTNKKKRKF